MNGYGKDGEFGTDAVFDFLRAAAPWVIMGAALAIFFVRSAAGKKQRSTQEEKPRGNYGTEGMCMGMCFGAAIGAALKGSIAMGLSLGMLAGMAAGSCIPKKEDSDK